MLSSTTVSAIRDPHNGNSVAPPRRIRHITGIQIRNLTPYPVRDAVTTALTQPTGQSHFTASGAIDDLGAILSRRHTRKPSTNSTATRPSLKWDDGIPEDKDAKPSLSRGRRESTSSTISSSSFNISTSSSRSTRSLRGHRPRTSSIASSSSNFLANIFDPTGESSSFASSLLPDNSQTGLEKIINSRMVETFIVINIPEDMNQVIKMSSPDVSADIRTPLRSAPLHKPSVLSSSRSQKLVTVSPSKKEPSLATLPHKNRISTPGSAPPLKTTFKTPVIPKRDVRTKPSSASKVNGVGFPSSISATRSSKGDRLPEKEQDLSIESNPSATPIYFSPIHRPSTNPFFSIDARSGQDFPQRSNTSGRFLKIEIWAKIPIASGQEELNLHRKFQHGTPQTVSEERHDWKLLEQRDVDLNKLLPLPADLDANPSQLPSNTVVMTLSPPGHNFYLPISSPPPSRPSSPHDGYTSDPELEVRKVKQFANPPHSAAVASSAELIPISRRRRHKDAGGNSIDFRDQAKTATWQELFKLVNLQSLVLDNESSLAEIIRKIDSLLEEDAAFPLRREVSEREARIGGLNANYQVVLDQTAQKRLEIAERSRSLHQRSEMLASARDALQLNTEVDVRIENERHTLASIRQRMDSTKTSLLSTLSTIFPIELYSPPELLFTILDVPLPIPLNLNDPAPPLSMLEHKDVTEDSVATALGYVAQVLQILAAYMGKTLIYPVTCIGSRSLIRDGISAMVGPRMFPLFSKGVDTYRFEYGVFLLNKDIEMLMSERDLRALDMRHTLPNLKNLLLTLSHDNAFQHPPTRAIPPSPISPISFTGLETPSREPSPVIDDVHTPKASHIVLETHGLGESTTTPTASGTTTPTASTISDDSRKQRSFLGFVPFTDFLRGRYPSSASHSSEKTPTASRRPSEVDEDFDSEDEQDREEDSESDEDRTTIHGASSDGVPDTLTRDGGIVAET